VAGDDVSRRTWVPSALIDQMSFVSSESTIRPSKDPMSIRGPEADGEATEGAGVGDEAAGERDPFGSSELGEPEHAVKMTSAPARAILHMPHLRSRGPAGSGLSDGALMPPGRVEFVAGALLHSVSVVPASVVFVTKAILRRV
jgi:hypothetical protein